MKFIISTGNSRKDKVWKEKTVSWDEFVQRLSQTTVTSETGEEYRKMKKYQQDNIKDVGGFVAGKLKDKVCVHEMWCECLGKDKTNLKRQDSYEIIGVLMRIGGWETYSGNKQGQTRFPIYGNQKTFCRVKKEN